MIYTMIVETVQTAFICAACIIILRKPESRARAEPEKKKKNKKSRSETWHEIWKRGEEDDV